MTTLTITLGDREINLGKALPLTLGDWRRLEQQGISPAKLAEGKVNDLVVLLLHVLHKADSTVTEAEVEALSLTDPRIVSVMSAINDGEAQLDRPS
jgi:hypothetical protein